MIDIKSSFVFGNISQEDCDKINIALAEIATRFDMLTLVKK